MTDILVLLKFVTLHVFSWNISVRKTDRTLVYLY